MNAVILEPTFEWKPYYETIRIEPTARGQATLTKIEQNMDAAKARLTCFIASHPKVPLYGWQFCVPCGLWFGPPMNLEDIDTLL